MGKIRELQGEFKTIFAGQGRMVIISLIPLILFLILNSLTDLIPALIPSLLIALIIFLFSLFQKMNLRYAVISFAGPLLAAGFIYLSGSESGILIPGLISGGITVFLCLVSVFIKQPLAAWTSYITRRWPLDWYWHNQVRPAYTEVTLIWAGAFSARLAIEYWLFQQQSLNSPVFSKLLLGWPYTIFILIISYLFGSWRLGKLAGPSVKEFESGILPPWEGQKSGF